MDALVSNRLERRMEIAVAALFGLAVGYATFLVLHGQAQPAIPYACAAGLGGFLVSLRMLGSVGGRRDGFKVASFAPRVLEFSELEELLLGESDRVRSTGPAELVLKDADRLRHREELLLTDADRLQPASGVEPLILDDVLAEMGPDSRVVRLFDRKAMPTPGQLKSRIDEHLSRGSMPDASQALHDALADLRRSLR